MPTVDGNRVARAGGHLIKDPTSLAGTYPTFGGTNLGAVSAMVAQRNAVYGPHVIEERNAPENHLYLGDAWVVTVILRQFHPDVLTTVFPNTAGSGATTTAVGRGAFREGMWLSEKACTLLWVPHDKSNAPALIAYAACPAPEDLGLAFSVLREHTYLCNFLVKPDGQGRTVNHGYLAGLSL